MTADPTDDPDARESSPGGPERALDGTAEPSGDPRGVRERILDAAVAILRESGGRGFSQGQVARRAGIRQSHLTYYFPKRHDLLEELAGRFIEEVTHAFREAGGDPGSDDTAVRLLHFAEAIADVEHMRLFTSVIVESEADPKLRGILARGTERLHGALAAELAGEDADGRARQLLAAMWGLGLHRLVLGERADPEDPARLIRSFVDSGPSA